MLSAIVLKPVFNALNKATIVAQTPDIVIAAINISSCFELLLFSFCIEQKNWLTNVKDKSQPAHEKLDNLHYRI